MDINEELKEIKETLQEISEMDIQENSLVDAQYLALLALNKI